MGNRKGDMSMSYLHSGRSKPIVHPQITGINLLDLFCYTGESTQAFLRRGVVQGAPATTVTQISPSVVQALVLDGHKHSN